MSAVARLRLLHDHQPLDLVGALVEGKLTTICARPAATLNCRQGAGHVPRVRTAASSPAEAELHRPQPARRQPDGFTGDDLAQPPTRRQQQPPAAGPLAFPAAGHGHATAMPKNRAAWRRASLAASARLITNVPDWPAVQTSPVAGPGKCRTEGTNLGV